MKKLLLMVLLALLVYGMILVAPVGIFFLHFSSLEVTEDLLPGEIRNLSMFSIVEATGEPEEEANPNQNVVVTVPEETISSLLSIALTTHENMFMQLQQVTASISPEMIKVAVSWRYGLLEHQIYETTVFSEWLVRSVPGFVDADALKRIELKPRNIYTNHLYTVNWSKLWMYVTKTDTSDGWLTLPSKAELAVRDITLKEHKIALNMTL